MWRTTGVQQKHGVLAVQRLRGAVRALLRQLLVHLHVVVFGGGEGVGNGTTIERDEQAHNRVTVFPLARAHVPRTDTRRRTVVMDVHRGVSLAACEHEDLHEQDGQQTITSRSKPRRLYTTRTRTHLLHAGAGGHRVVNGVLQGQKPTAPLALLRRNHPRTGNTTQFSGSRVLLHIER